MACCGQRTIAKRTTKVQAASSTPQMIFTTDRTAITGLDGVSRTFQVPLVRAPGRPSGGWRVTLPVKGQRITVDGRTPVEVYNASHVLFRRNGINVSANDLWLNLNIQWLQRSPEKYHLVPLSDLLMVSQQTDQPTDKRKRSYKPMDWGAIAWGWLNLFLAREDYHFREFVLQCKYVLDMLNPATNPEIGCAECYKEFSIHIARLEKDPATDRDGARRWLVSTHNMVNQKLNKKVLTFEEAAKKAFWV